MKVLEDLAKNESDDVVNPLPHEALEAIAHA